MKWFFLLPFCFYLPMAGADHFSDLIRLNNKKKEVLWDLPGTYNDLDASLICLNPSEKGQIGPFPRKSDENLEIVSEDLVKINFSNQVYIDTDPAIDYRWISQIGERYGFPFGLEFGKIFKFSNVSFNANFLGYYNKFFGYPGEEYALRAQISFPFPN